MKRLYISISIIVVVVSVGIIGLWHFNTVSEELDIMLEQAMEAVDNDEIEKAEQLNNKLYSYWSKHSEYIVLYVRHNDIDQITNLMSELEPLLKYGDKSYYMSNLSTIRLMLERIGHEETPGLTNIF